MVKLRLAGGQIYFGRTVLGPATALVVEHNELIGLDLNVGVIHATLPAHIDMVFAAGQRLVVVESKRGGDFISSWLSGRLARQITTLLETGHRPLLLLRWEGAVMPELEPPTMKGRTTWWSDIVRFQQLGVTVAFGPTDDDRVPSVLSGLRPALAGGRNPLAAIRRSDIRHPTYKGAGGFLCNIKGIGPVTAERLHAKFGSTAAALAAPSSEWRKAGVSAKVIDRRDKILE